jgi:hypothetical protein
LAQYAIYFFDGEAASGDFDEFVCATDAEAINAMLDRAGGRPVELWSEGRKVLWWPGDPHACRRRPAQYRRCRSTPFTAVA